MFLGKCTLGHEFGYKVLPQNCPYIVNGKDCKGKPCKVEEVKKGRPKKDK